MDQMSSQLHAPAALSPRTESPYLVNVAGPKSRSGRYGENKNFLPIPEF